MPLSMKHIAMSLVLAMPLLAGCASNICDDLAFEQEPQNTPPLAMPEGVPAIPEGSEYRVPKARGDTVASDTCLAQPPMTLPPEVLEAAEDSDDEA